MGESAPGLLGLDDAARPLHLRYEDRTAHVALIGKSRFGKTTVLEHLIRDDLERGTGVILLDAHGDLSKRIFEIAPDTALPRMNIVQLDERSAFGLNLYECRSRDSLIVDRVVGNIVEVFKKLFLDERGFYPVIEEGLRSSAYVIIANGYTLHEVPFLFTDKDFLRRALRDVSNPTVLSYWSEYQQLPAREQRELRWPVLNKVNRFLASDAIKYMVAQSRTTIPFEAALERGECLIFRLSGDNLDRDTAAFLGMVFLNSLSNAVAQRAGRIGTQRPRVHVYLDEYGRFATRTTDRMLEEFGKYELGLTIAHQKLEQVGGNPASTASLVMFQLEGQDAPKMALHLDTTPTRTKKVIRLRTEPDYETWTESEWDDETYRLEHERLLEEAKKQREVSADWEHKLDRLRELWSHPWESGVGNTSSRFGRWNGRTDIWVIRDVLAGTPVKETSDLHRLFNPEPFYYRYVMCKDTPPGEMLTRSGSLGLFKLDKDRPTWAYEDNEEDVYEGYCLKDEAASWAWLVQRFRRWHEHFHHRHYGRDSETDEWCEGLSDELAGLLREVYRERRFFLRVGYKDTWGSGFSPGPTRGSERPADTNWTQNYWTVSPVPEGVRWLTQKVQQVVAGQRSAAGRAEEAKARASALYKAHAREVERRELRGHKAVSQSAERLRLRNVYNRGGQKSFSTLEPTLQDEKVYDEVEELDQTHADRAAEIATQLASLPKFVAYCKLLDEHGNPHEYRVRTSPPARQQRTVVIENMGEWGQSEGTSWRVVQDEIEKRFQTGAGPKDEPAPPVIGRRT